MKQYEYQLQSSLEHSTDEPFYTSLSFWSLVITNLVVVVWAIRKELSMGLMVWVYLFQNIILGFFWIAKVFASPMDSSYAKKIQGVTVFLPHYLIIHFLYAVSLYNFFGKELFTNFKYILMMAGIFFLSEAVSYFAGNSLNRASSLSLAKSQLFPYARVVPMHFVMIFGITLEVAEENTRLAIICFLLLKTFADVSMFLVERSSVFGNLVTDLVEMHRGRDLSDWTISNSKKEQEMCQFCQRVIGRNETPWVIKENVVCEDCYKKIEIEKKKVND